MSKKNLKVWLISSYVTNEVPKYITEFKRLEKFLDITIDLKIMTWNRAYDSLINAFKNENPPDVFALGSTWIYTFAHLGYLKHVPSTYKVLPSLANWINNCSMYNNIRYAIPWFIQPLVLSTQQIILDKYNISQNNLTNWDDFYYYCKKISEGENNYSNTEKHIPFAFPAKSDIGTLHLYMSWIYKANWDFPDLNKSSDNLFDAEFFIEVFEYISSLMNICSLNIQEDHIYSRILYEKFYRKNEVTFYLDHAFLSVSKIMQKRINNYDYDGPYTFTPVPSKSSKYNSFAGGALLTVSSKTQYPAEAWEIIRHLTSDNFLEEWSSQSGDLPAFHCSFWDKHKKCKEIGILYNEIINSKSYPSHPLWRNIEVILSKGISEFFWELRTSDTILRKNNIQAIQKKINESIKNLLNLTWEMKTYE
ncbi:MAG: extracellular solute-binding protein [Eubacteriales bacterium]